MTTKSLRTNEPKLTGPFKATQIWNDIVLHLKTSVDVKRRRYKMRHYENSFTGTDAADVVLHYLLNDRDTFCTDMSREKAIKLCQTLMDRSVFESVTSRSSELKKGCFEDSTSKLYCFKGCNKESKLPTASDEDLSQADDEDLDELRGQDDDIGMNSELESDLLLDGDIICNPIAVNKRGQIMQEIIDISRALKHRSSSSLKFSTSIKQARCSPLREQSPPVVNADELCREVALSQLLTLIDLPILDGLLSDSKKPPRDHDASSSGRHTNSISRHWCTSPASGVCLDDPWMRAALDCLERLPRGLAVLDKDFAGQADHMTKLQLFEIVHSQYSGREALLPEKFLDLHLAILNLILERKDVAKKVLQLDMIIMPYKSKHELQCLLRFLSVASADSSCRLHTQFGNHDYILSKFSNSIIKHKVLAVNLASVLVSFMIQHQAEIFSQPRDIEEIVQARLAQIKQGHLPIIESTFCERVSDEEYTRQMKDGTQQALVDMMNGVLDDITLSLKEKKQKLRHFQKFHPQLHAQYFSGMI